MDVLLVAAKKEKIADYTGVIAQAGRTAVVVDVDAFALQNAFEVNYGIEPGQVVVLLNAGASATNINILQGDQSVFTRDISIGGNAYTEALQKELNLPYEQADQLKRGEPVDGVTFEDARPVLRAVSENVMLEIQKTFDFFKATASSDRIDRIVVSGGASRAEGFLEMLTERFEAPVELFDPFKRVAFDAKRFQVDDVDEVARDGGRRGRAGSATGGGPMIRINLLAVERERTRKRVLIPPAHRVTIGATVILLGTALLIGWWFWSLRQESTRVDEELARAETETRQIRSVLEQVRKFESQQRPAAAARHADRAAAQGPVRAGPPARRDQQEPARSPVAERADADRQRLHDQRRDRLADRRLGLRGEPGSDEVVQEAGRDRRQPGHAGPQGRGPDQVPDQGAVRRSHGTARAAGAGQAGQRPRPRRVVQANDGPRRHR